MLNVKETLKRLHKRLPTLSLDDLFEVLDCYVEEITFSFKPENNNIWKDLKSPWETVTYNTVKSDPLKYNLTTSTDGKITYYDGGGSSQLIAEH